MSEIILKNVDKVYDKSNSVIQNLNMMIPDGSFTVLVGPSGCGKSTTLRMIAGLEKPSDGELYIGGKLVNDLEPGDRDISMVFQNYALYPTMTVRENIEFGLINNKVPKRERECRIQEISEIVGLSQYLGSKPSKLSGGQRQRVALARAMVKKPKVFLMDEPLSNLDAKLRAQMRTELIELHKSLKTTFVYVTHDQTEAMSMATNIALMDKGEIQQMDTPFRIYNDPVNEFTAQFIGMPVMNLFDRQKLAPIIKLPEIVQKVGFRPSKAQLWQEGMDPQDWLISDGILATRELMGSEIIYRVHCSFGTVTFETRDETQLEVDSAVRIAVSKKFLHFFDTDRQRIREGA